MWDRIKGMIIKPSIQKTKKAKMVSVRLSNDDMLVLDNLAEEMDMSRSHIVRRILQTFFKEYGLRVEDGNE